MKKITLVSTILFLLFVNSNFASAQEAEKLTRVKTFVNDIGNRIVKIAANKSLSEKAKKDQIIAEIDIVVDSNWIARFVLGKNYKDFSETQKTQFQNLYRQFMINTYGPKFNNYNGRKFTVLSVEKQKMFYVVKCEFLPVDSNVAISVDFRVKDKDGKLVILDFVAEGVSLIESQRSEYDSAISQGGIDKFIKDFSKKVDVLKK